MLNSCIDISKWEILHTSSPKGSRDKKWVVNPVVRGATELFLFKESHKRHPAEFWSEIAAHRIGNLVGVSTPETFCARFETTYAALIRFFLKTQGDEIVEDLRHGGDLILANHPGFDRRKGETHNVFFVQEVLAGALKGQDLYEEFLQILVFDALIGNTDRHQDNWGLVEGVNQERTFVRLAPAFDNSDSLGRELVEEKLDGFLHESGVQLKQYIKKGLPHLRWSADGKNLEWINHFELLKRLAEKRPLIVNYVKVQTSFTEEAINSILDPLAEMRISNPKFALSVKRLSLIKKIIIMRRDTLRQTFGLV